MLSIQTKAAGAYQTAFKNISEFNHINQVGKKPVAPFGKALLALINNGKKPQNNIFTFIGYHAIQKAKAFEKSQFVLALPYGSDPDEYYWPVQNCHPLIFDKGGISNQTIRKLAFILLNVGALVVHIVLQNNSLVVYRKETV